MANCWALLPSAFLSPNSLLPASSPIQAMIADADFSRRIADPVDISHNAAFLGKPLSIPSALRLDLPMGDLTEILTPVALSGFTSGTLQAFSSDFRRLGLQPQQGVSAGSPKSQQYSGTVVPGSMICVQLVAGDLSISADGTVTHVDGKRVYAFGHRFLEGGSTELPFARADVIALLPALNTSFKISTAKQWVGTIISDRNTSIAGEMGREAHMLPVAISVRSRSMGIHDYHLQVVNDRLLTPFLIQTAIFSTIDATERTLGAGTLRLRGVVQFEGDVPSLLIHDMFVSDSGLAQQVSADAVVSLAFTLSAGFRNLRIKNISFELEPVEIKRQLQISQVWTSRARSSTRRLYRCHGPARRRRWPGVHPDRYLPCTRWRSAWPDQSHRERCERPQLLRFRRYEPHIFAQPAGVDHCPESLSIK